MTASSSRRRLVLFYGIVGAATAMSFAELLIRLGRLLLASIPETGDSFGLALLYGSAFGAVVWLTALLKPRWSHFVFAGKYPPAVLAVPVAGLLLIGFGLIATSLDHARGMEVLVAGLAGLIFFALVLIRAFSQHGSRTAVAAVDQTFDDWLRGEAPIETAVHDRFNHLYRAKRILAAVKTERVSGTHLSQTVLVRGAYGTGKTSLINLVRELAFDERIVFVSVNCWGFESSTRAREHVLARCVESLAQIVDCTGLRSVPRHYIEAIGAAGSWAKPFAAVFGAPVGPRTVLKAFDGVLAAIDYQLVVVVEDADRSGRDFDATDIEAMLHDFRSAPRLSFILTVGNETHLELPKLAEVIEFLPTIPINLALQYLDEIRTELREQESFIDPPSNLSSSGHRPKSLRRDYEAPDRVAPFVAHYRNWPERVARLLATPRRLKSFLGTLRRDWPALRGEVDLDEWIMVLALRHAAGPAFTFLGTHLEDLRRASPQGWGQSAETKASHERHIAQLCEAWKHAVRDSDFDRDAAEVLLVELIPACNTVFPDRRQYPPKRLQSIHWIDGPDYWTRMNAGTVAPNDVRDQDVLRLLIAAPSDSVAVRQLAERGVGSVAFAERLVFIEDYVGILRSERRLEFFAHAHDALLAREGPTASSDSRGYSELHRGLKIANVDDSLLARWLGCEAPRVAAISLRLANDLVHAHTKYSSIVEEVRRAYGVGVRELFDRPDSQLARRLDPSYPYSLYHLIFYYGQEGQESLLSRPQDWQWMAPRLLDALREAPATTLPQVLRIIGDQEPKHPNFPHDYVFVVEKLEGLFGSLQRELLQLLASVPNEFPSLSPGDRHWVALGIKRAQNELARLN